MRALFIAAAAVSLASAAAAAPVGPPGVDRGAHVAQRDCAACHAVGQSGRSPNMAAPTFRQIARRYNPISLERALSQIAQKGHFDMPAHMISEADAADLTAYIDDLDRKRP